MTRESDIVKKSPIVSFAPQELRRKKSGQSIEQLEMPHIYAEFVDFVVCPKDERRAKFGGELEAEFCKIKGIDTNTPWRWKQRDHFPDDCWRAIKRYLASRTDILSSAIIERTEKDPNYARMFKDFLSPTDGLQLTFHNLNMYQIDNAIISIRNSTEEADE